MLQFAVLNSEFETHMNMLNYLQGQDFVLEVTQDYYSCGIMRKSKLTWFMYTVALRVFSRSRQLVEICRLWAWR